MSLPLLLSFRLPFVVWVSVVAVNGWEGVGEVLLVRREGGCCEEGRRNAHGIELPTLEKHKSFRTSVGKAPVNTESL